MYYERIKRTQEMMKLLYTHVLLYSYISGVKIIIDAIILVKYYFLTKSSYVYSSALTSENSKLSIRQGIPVYVQQRMK